MKRMIAFLFFSFFLLANTELGQLLKVPVLVQHFWEHRSENPTVSFLSFLSQHYYQPNSDSHQQKHEELPFKSPEVHFSNVVFHAFAAAVDPEPVAYPVKTAFAVLSHGFYSLPHPDDVWQPPRWTMTA